MSAVVPIEFGHGADIDVNETWRQIGRDTLMSVGAHNHALSRDDVQFDVRGSHRPYRRIVVQLAADDTYNVGIGYLEPIVYDWVWEATEFGIYCDGLADRVMVLYKEYA